MPQNSRHGPDRPTVFISYSHQDTRWKDRLVRHLQVLEPEGVLEVWDDRRIAAGADWLPEIEGAMDRAVAAVLLVSADFLVSGFILGTEVPRLLERRWAAGLLVIPLIVHPCDWQGVGWLASINCRPVDGRPLSRLTKPKADEALAALVKEIRQLLCAPQQRLALPFSQLDVGRLPISGPQFVGREAELALGQIQAVDGASAGFPILDPMRIMTAPEVAGYLRIDEATVRSLIRKGTIPHFEVAGEPRVQHGALVQWLQSEMESASLNTLRQELERPGAWKRALEQNPELSDRVQTGKYEEGTFGAFLKGLAEGREVRPRSSSPALDARSQGVARPLIFICHASLDKEFVRDLSARLNKDGVATWVDELEIHIGDSIHEKVKRGLSQSDFFAIVLSKASVKSRWVREELASASAMEKYLARGVLVLPVLIEECDIPSLLLDRRYANFRDDADSAYHELLDSILHHFERRHPHVNLELLRVVEPRQDARPEAASNASVLKQLAPRHFEELVAQLLGAAGYEVRLAPLSRDGGYDIIASPRAALKIGATEQVIVECKAWKDPVGVDAVHRLAALKALNPGTRVVLVTTSRFTGPARNAAKAAGIDLVDADALARWMREGRMPPLSR